MAGRVFAAFIIIVASFFLFVLDITQATYDFRTQVREDSFGIDTAVGVTSANVTLLKSLYDDDTGTITYESDITETVLASTYNNTTRELLSTGLTANTSRTLVVSYDISSLTGSTALDNALNWFPFIWYILVVAFIAAALMAIFTSRR